MSFGAPASRTERLATWLAGGAGALLLAMLAVMVVDVVGRKFFDRPLLGAVEMVERLLLLSVYAAVPLVSCRRDHIRIELMDPLVPPALRGLRARASEAANALLLLGCAWLAGGRALQTWQAGDSTTLLSIKLWPFDAAVALLLVATAAVHAVLAAQRPAQEP